MKYFVMILFLIGFLGFQFADGLIEGHPLEFWNSADIILDGVILEKFNETDGLVQHDIKVEQYFKNPKSQMMITVYGPGIYSEEWFYPKIFEKGQRALFYLKKIDDKYIILEQSIQVKENCAPRSMIGLSTLPGEPIARGGLTLFYDPYQNCNGYLTPPGFLRESLPPLKQWQSGIKLGDIGCHNDLQLMFRHSGQPVACVKNSSVLRLLDYGWTLVEQGELQLRTPLPTVTIADLPKQIDNETPLSFAIEVMDIIENHDRPTISITDENQQKVWSGQWLTPNNSGGIASSVEYSVQYYKEDFPEKIILEPGNYMVSVSINKQTVSKKVVVVPKLLGTEPESKVSPQEFLLDLGEKGEFSLGYRLKGAELQSITKDPSMESLNVELANSKNDGYFEITIPRNLLDAKIGDSDDTFVVIADKYEVPYTEITNDFDRKVRVEFNEGTKLIKIIATVPLSSKTDYDPYNVRCSSGVVPYIPDNWQSSGMHPSDETWESLGRYLIAQSFYKELQNRNIIFEPACFGVNTGFVETSYPPGFSMCTAVTASNGTKLYLEGMIREFDVIYFDIDNKIPYLCNDPSSGCLCGIENEN